MIVQLTLPNRVNGLAHRRVIALLSCGVLASLLYISTDQLAAARYPGYSLAAQAVSELFAIGAPTSQFVVPLFTLSSLLLAAFSFGIWLSSASSRALRFMALMFFGNAVNSLVLWNFYPMHMRGQEQTFTDLMHAILAINPFVLVSIVSGIVAFKKWLRAFSVTATLLLLIPAIIAFSYVPALAANQPTPWLGLTERIAQYGTQLWQIALAIGLLSKESAEYLKS